MDFQQLLQKQLAEQNSGDRERVDYPSSHLKNKELFFPKAVGATPSSVLIRILPPATPGENYCVPMREIFLQTRNRNGKDLKMNAVLSAFPNQEDMLERAIIDWQARNMVPNNYNRAQKPSTKFLCNVVQIVQNPQTGQYEEERDPQTGQLVVRMLKLPYSACNTINQKLVDAKYYPQQLANVDPSIAQYSFISSEIGYAIQLSKPLKGSGGMSYGVDVFTNIAMGALPAGWENLLEDLNYQATPSVEYNKDYVEYFISVVNGTEPVSGQSQAPVQQGYQAPAFATGVPQAPVAPPVQPTQPVAPLQPTGGYQATNMGTPAYGQTNMGVAPTMPVQPVQPVAPVAPTTPAMPVMPSTVDHISDADLPSNLTSMPNVEQPVQVPTPTAPVAPVQSMPTPVATPVADQAPVAETTVGTPHGLPNIDELLKGMAPQ